MQYAGITALVGAAIFGLGAAGLSGLKEIEHVSYRGPAAIATTSRNRLCEDRRTTSGEYHCNGFIVMTKGKETVSIRLTGLAENGSPQGLAWRATGSLRRLGSDVDDCLDFPGNSRQGCSYVSIHDPDWQKLNQAFFEKVAAYRQSRHEF